MDLTSALGGVLGSAVLASVLTSFLNNAFLSRREHDQRTRQAIGMLQRARSAVTMLLQAAHDIEHYPDTDFGARLASVREIMLSTEFATTTADLDLEAAYQSLEQIHAHTRTLEENSERLAQYVGDIRTFGPVDSDGVENPDYDPEVAMTRYQYEKWQENYVKRVSEPAQALKHHLESTQRKLSGRG